MTEQWRDLGRGTGKRPDSVTMNDTIRFRHLEDSEWRGIDVDEAVWDYRCEYQLLVRTPADSEPVSNHYKLPNTPSEAVIEAIMDVNPIGCCAINEREAAMIYEAVIEALAATDRPSTRMSVMGGPANELINKP